LHHFAQFLLAATWSFAFLQLLTDPHRNLGGRLSAALRNLGRECDARTVVATAAALRRRLCQSSDDISRNTTDMAQVKTRSGVKPELVLNLPGMVTVHKPSDWEVDGLVVDEGGHPPLSAYMQSIFPKMQFPLVWDAERSYGFLHRLDIPSSGLVLGGTTLEGYYCLRLQLDAQCLRREYIVLSHDMAALTLRKIAARVDMAPEPTQRRSVADSGKPSHTHVVVQVHVHGCTPQDEGPMCLVAIRIGTGRRHQIRVHLRHCGHPSVSDARYTCREVQVMPAMPLSNVQTTPTKARRAKGMRWTYNLSRDS